MILENRGRFEAVSIVGADGQLNELGRLRLARELFCDGYRPGRRLAAAKYKLVAYTDGITDAASTSGQLWGMERLESLLRSCSRMTPGEIVDRILGEVSDFANGEPQRDDVTLVVMQVQEGCDI